MKTLSPPNSIRNARLITITGRLLTALALGSTCTSLQAQTIIASGQVSGVQASPGVFDYTLTISEGNGTTTPIGSLWYAWVPGSFFLPSTPTSASGPNGWTANIVGNSIQFSSGSTATDIAPGASDTFDFVASFSPDQLAAAPNSGLSVAYAGAVNASSPNETFSVQQVPEPSVSALLFSGVLGLGVQLLWRARRSHSLNHSVSHHRMQLFIAKDSIAQ